LEFETNSTWIDSKSGSRREDTMLVRLSTCLFLGTSIGSSEPRGNHIGFEEEQAISVAICSKEENSLFFLFCFLFLFFFFVSEENPERKERGRGRGKQTYVFNSSTRQRVRFSCMPHKTPTSDKILKRRILKIKKLVELLRES